jgi:hypothetical protein
MGVTIKKYGVSVSFCRKLMIFTKTAGLCILSEKFNFSKTYEHSYTGQLCITDL